MCTYESFAALHFSIAISVFQLEFQCRKALVVLFVEEKGSGNEKLKRYVVVNLFIMFEEGVYFFVISVSEVALS